MTPFFFNPRQLKDLALEHREEYQNAKPFAHIAFNDFLLGEIISQLIDEFPGPEEILWKNKTHDHSIKKLTSADENQMGLSIRHILAEFNSWNFLSFLELLTGITGLIPDPRFEGGGMHQIMRGGSLDIHADFNKHEKLDLDRRLNVILYLNKEWKEEYGGALELWSKDMKRCEEKIFPMAGRLVIFSTTDFSFHGHPDPLNCPGTMTRKSLALYYYSNGRPPEEISSAHSTLYQLRPNDKKSGEIRKVIKKIVPPILWDAIRPRK